MSIFASSLYISSLAGRYLEPRELSMTDMEGMDSNPTVHFIEVLTSHHLDTSFADLEVKYKNAIKVNKGLQLLPPPFGLRGKAPADCKIQIVIQEDSGGTHTIFKHLIFPQKCKTSVVRSLVFGHLSKPNYMQSKPSVGRKILQYCLQQMGGRQFRCFDLSADACAPKKTKAFDDLEEDALDKGFDFLTRHAPRSATDLQQLRWQTKELRKASSPIHGRCVSFPQKVR